MTDPELDNNTEDDEESENYEEDERELTDLSEEEKISLIQQMAQRMYIQDELIETQQKALLQYQQKLQQATQQKEKSLIDIVISAEETTYSDIGGLNEVLTQIKHFEYGIKYPKVYQAYGIESPKGLLMYGPPGCGKTMIAKAMSSELDCWFMELPLTQVISKYVGEAERNLEQAVENARKKYKETKKKVILFVDEAEQMFRKKGQYADGPQVIERCVNVWLRTMDGMGSNEGLIFVAATNHLEQIDDAMRRAGRFDYIVEIPKPEKEGVLDIFVKQMRMRERKACKEVYAIEDVPKLAEQMYSLDFTGADIAEVLKQASWRKVQHFVERFENAGVKRFGKDEYLIRDNDILNILDQYDRIEEEKSIGFGV